MSEASTGSPGDAVAAASTPTASTTAATMPSPSVVADHNKGLFIYIKARLLNVI